MKEVKVSRTDLLVELKKNKDKHQAVFAEALIGYQARAIEVLEDCLAKAKAGKREAMSFSLPLPVNQTHEYNRAIRMMEMSTEDTITLTSQEFDCYVMDRWHWKQSFLTANSMYSKIAADTVAEDAEL